MFAPRALKTLCARDAQSGASGRPLNFTVRPRALLAVSPRTMFVATTYFLTALTVWALVALASRQHHQRLGDTRIFRYPAVYRYFFTAVFFFFVGAGFYSIATIPPSPVARAEWFISVVVSGLFCVLSLFGLAWTLRRYVAASETAVLVQGILKQRQFKFTDVQSITVLNGFRGARDLRVCDSSGQLLMTVGGTIEDFDDLVALMRSRTRGQHVLFRERDALGQWHDARAP